MRSTCARLTLVTAVVIVVVVLAASNLLAQGAETFKGKCSMCHGPDGSGKTVMGEKLKLRDLGSAEVQKQSDAELAQTMTKGKNKMPAFEGKLSKEQIDQLVGHLRELGKKH